MTAVLGALLGSACIHLMRAARRIGTRPEPVPTVWQAIPPGARWLPCHTTSCAHLTTIHTPHEGAWQCADCGHTRIEATDGR